MTVTGTNRFFHTVGRNYHILMLPNADDFPPTVPEHLIYGAVTVYVGGEFSLPPLGVGLGESLVVRTTVPKTAVDENGNPYPSENDVWSSAAEPREWQIHTISKASAMEFTADGHLRFGVTIADSAHLCRLGSRW